MEPSNLEPPSYQEATIGRQRPRIMAHNQHCTEQSNEQYMMSDPHLQTMYLPIREWIRGRPGATAAEAPWWWTEQNNAVTWDTVKQPPDTPTAPAQENFIQRLRRLCIESAASSIPALGGIPLKPGDIEYTFNTEDWTHDWGWEVELCAYVYPEHIRCSDWFVNMRIHLQDLPRQLTMGGIQWRDAVASDYTFWLDLDPEPERSWDWKLKATCSSVGQDTCGPEGKSWEARVKSWRRVLPPNVDFWSFLSDETIFSASIKQRTGTDKYKTVMWYSHSTAYANDLTGQTVCAWHDGLSERFVEFISPLVPRGPSVRPPASTKQTTGSVDGEATLVSNP